MTYETLYRRGDLVLIKGSLKLISAKVNSSPIDTSKVPERTFKILVDKYGNLKRVLGIPPDTSKLLSSTFSITPERPLKVGETWTRSSQFLLPFNQKVNVLSKFRLEKLIKCASHKCLLISSLSEGKNSFASLRSDRSFLFDLYYGVIRESRGKTSIEVIIRGKDSQNGRYQLELNWEQALVKVEEKPEK